MTPELDAALAAAVARLAEPLEPGETTEDRIAEVCTGSLTHPGVYWEGGELAAWDDDPAGGDPVTVTAADLSTPS